MAHYLVRARPHAERLAELEARLRSGEFLGLRPLGPALTRALAGARRDPATGEALWEEEDYCRPPLVQEREAVLDRYFEDLQVEPVGRGEGWARIAHLPPLWPGEPGAEGGPGLPDAAVEALPPRRGPRPETRRGMPHQQLTQNAPPELQEALFRRARALPGVRVAPSAVSVPGARAFVLDEGMSAGPPEAFMAGREFAHLHPPHDGSLHLALPAALARRVAELGWGEPHPLTEWGALPPGLVMIYGPRDGEELEAVWTILRASYAFARGLLAPGGGLGAGDGSP